MGKRPVVAIDGPGGAGKSTVARMLADRLGYLQLDTGAMYRAVALAASRAGISYTDSEALDRLCQSISIDLKKGSGGLRTFLDGEDVSEAIRTPQMSEGSSAVSAVEQVRRRMVTLQRRIAREGGVVAEGRDMGTVVSPDTPTKFFLDASMVERGRRRWQELSARGVVDSLENVTEQLLRRDRQDSERAHSPLRRAGDAFYIDTSFMSPEEVVEIIYRRVREAEGRND